jgi:cobalt-zinc-cadmium efflux system outer membrane protein
MGTKSSFSLVGTSVIVPILLGLLSANLAGAANPAIVESGGALTLECLLKTARSQNPEIRAAEARYQAMRQRPIQEGTLPDPSVGVRYHNEQFGRITYGRSEFSYLELSTEQEVPFPGKLGLRASAASREAERERAMRDFTILSVLAKVAAAYAELSAIDRSNAILAESVNVLDTVMKQAASAYSVGMAAQQDILRATLERDGLRERIALLDLQRVSGEATINALLNQPATQPLPMTAWSDKLPQVEPFEALSARLDSQAPELRAAQEEVLRSEDTLKLAQREYFPDMALMGAYSNKNGLFAEWELGLRLKVPLYFWRRQRAAVAEATYGKSAAEFTRRSTSVNLGQRLRQLHSTEATAMRLVDLYSEKLIPEASLTLESARASYSVGKVDFLTILSAFNSLLEYRVRYTEEIGRFRRAFAEIGPLIGEPPPELSPDGVHK